MDKRNHTLTVFVGDTDTSLGDSAQSHDKSAYLISTENYQKLLQGSLTKDTTVYTALGDFSGNLELFYKILCSADKIVYCPPRQWSDNKKFSLSDPSNSTQGITELLLNLVPDTVNVSGMTCSIQDPNPVVDSRKTENAQVWSVGYSITHGIGIEPNQRYGQLVADQLDMQCSFLTRPGAAIDWAADQVLRADLRKNDVVLFALTNLERITYYHEHQLINVNIAMFEDIGVFDKFFNYESFVRTEDFFSHNTMYRHLYAIKQVINHCDLIGAKLFLIGESHGACNLLSYYRSQKNYIHMHYPIKFEKNILDVGDSYIDYGNDKSHPGPLQHQYYKQVILDRITNHER